MAGIMSAGFNLDDIDFIMRRMDAIGMITYLGITEDGFPNFHWNKAFRDETGGEQFAIVIRDVLTTLDGIPPLRMKDLRFIAYVLAGGCEFDAGTDMPADDDGEV